ncbi:MAG TPA: hypothetical protein PLW14_13475 [Chlorobiota bacterium]|nr:hypothetical protein [Chlorobiota bacterium]
MIVLSCVLCGDGRKHSKQWKFVNAQLRLMSLWMVLLAAVALPQYLQARPIDTVANIGVTSAFGKIIASDDGKEFVTVSTFTRHTIRSIDNPVQSLGTVGVRDSNGTYIESVPVAFSSDGGVILQTTSPFRLSKVRRGDQAIEWSIDDLGAREHGSGCDFLVASAHGGNESQWYIVHRDNGEYLELNVQVYNKLIVLPGSRFVVSLRPESMFVFDCQTGISRSNIVLPPDITASAINLENVGYDEIDGVPYALLPTSNREVIRRVSLIDGMETTPLSVPPLSLGFVSYSFSPDSRYVVANCYQDIGSTNITMVCFDVVGSTLEERFTTQLDAPAVFNPRVVWISPQSFAAHVLAGSFEYTVDRPEPRMIAAGVEVGSGLCLAQDGKGVMIDNVASTVFFDITTSKYTTYDAPFVSTQIRGTNTYISARSEGTESTIRFVDITSGSVVRSVRIPVLSGKRTSFLDTEISPSQQYVAACIAPDTVVIQDVIDTARSRIVVCEQCGTMELGFSADNRQLILAGEYSGCVVDLDSLSVSSTRPQLRMGLRYSKQLRVTASDDVLVLQNSRTLAMYSIPNDEYGVSITFPSRIWQATALDSTTIMCITGDYLYFLNANLELRDSVYMGPLVNRGLYALVPDKKLLLFGIQYSDLLLLRYDNVTSSVSQITPVEHGSTGERYVADDGVCTLVANNIENIEVYTLDGRSVTHMANLSVPTPGSVTVQLPQSPGPYIIVDRDTGRSVVVVK